MVLLQAKITILGPCSMQLLGKTKEIPPKEREKKRGGLGGGGGEEGRVNMLLSKIQNTDYMTSLISGSFCAFRASWGKYERASPLEWWRRWEGALENHWHFRGQSWPLHWYHQDCDIPVGSSE